MQNILIHLSYEIEKLDPTIAKPFSPQNITVARELQGIELDKAYIGSCTGAKLEDLRMAAKILKGKKVRIRTEVVPAAQSIYLKAVNEGLINIFIEAGAVVGPPTCGSLLWCSYGSTRKRRDMYKYD